MQISLELLIRRHVRNEELIGHLSPLQVSTRPPEIDQMLRVLGYPNFSNLQIYWRRKHKSVCTNTRQNIGKTRQNIHVIKFSRHQCALHQKYFEHLKLLGQLLIELSYKICLIIVA